MFLHHQNQIPLVLPFLFLSDLHVSWTVVVGNFGTELGLAVICLSLHEHYIGTSRVV